MDMVLVGEERVAVVSHSAHEDSDHIKHRDDESAEHYDAEVVEIWVPYRVCLPEMQEDIAESVSKSERQPQPVPPRQEPYPSQVDAYRNERQTDNDITTPALCPVHRHQLYCCIIHQPDTHHPYQRPHVCRDAHHHKLFHTEKRERDGGKKLEEGVLILVSK